jgi:membrane-associated phospholipid phosphatase
MKAIWENNWFLVPVALFLGFGLTIALLVPYGNEILLFNDLRREPLISVFKFFSWCGETWIWVIIGLLALFYRYRFALLIAMTGLIMPFVFILKDQVGTDRPITYFQKNGRSAAVVVVPQEQLNTGQTSFPSGHTMSAFGLSSLLALMAGPKSRKRVLVLALLAIAVGLSRIFLVQHFLVDVLAGALLGMGVSGFVWWLNGTPFFREKTWLDGKLRFPFWLKATNHA